jgi:phosphatidylglycerol---prolipoprotein diacylglyceryl transferase
MRQRQGRRRVHYPHIDPVIVSFGPIAIRWYGLAYLAGFLTAWWLGNRRAPRANWTSQQVSDLVFYCAIGAVVGGRIGYVFFYGLSQFVADPLWLFRIWDGGMSFHGGLIGAVVAMAWFGRATHRTFLQVADFAAPLVPPGLGFGRLGNFANTELPGRITDSPLGIVYPCHAVRDIDPTCTGMWEDFTRYPSPLFQAFAEGIVLFAIVWLYSAKPRRAGTVSGVFLMAYGALRFTTEWFRQPDAQLGFIAMNWLTMGQLLSLPMIAVGIVLYVYARRRAT